MLAESPLRHCGHAKRLLSGLHHDEEAVTLGAYLDAVVRFDRGTHDDL